MRAILIPAIDPSNAESKQIEQKENTKKREKNVGFWNGQICFWPGQRKKN